MHAARLNLLGATALALVLSFSIAQAEPPAASGNAGGAITGGAQINKGGPAGGALDSGGPSLDAQGGANAGADVGAGPSSKGAKTGANAGADVDGEASGKGAKAGANADVDDNAGRAAKGDSDMTTGGKAGATAEGQAKTDGKSGGKTKLGSQEVSKVRSYFHNHKPRANRVDRSEVNVSIGLALPGTIALYDLPQDVIVVEGACPIKYFVWDDDVVLVDSCTRQVVEIIVDVA
jgi:hypothetical protein